VPNQTEIANVIPEKECHRFAIEERLIPETRCFPIRWGVVSQPTAARVVHLAVHK
jgi:hypothetical protein